MALAETHTVILPYAVAYNASKAPDTMVRSASALGVPDATNGLYDLIGRLGLRRSLKELGMPEEGIDRVAGLACEKPYLNPRPIEREAIRELIARAWSGTPRV